MPVIVTVVPPAVGPAVGLTLVTVGAATYVYWSLALVALVPPGVVTVMSTVPADAGGRGRGDRGGAVDREAGRVVAPNLTAVAPVKLVPVIVTLVPPAVGPGGRTDAA